jgi:thiamine biosynthesis lipoprotein
MHTWRRTTSERLSWFLAVALTAAGVQPAPAQTDSLFHDARPAMGTTFDIYLYAAGAARAAMIIDEAFAEIDRVEALLSHYRADSELSRLNARAAHEPVTTEPELYALLDRALAYSRLTDGAFDVTVGRLMLTWGFFRGRGTYPSAKALAAARAQTGWRNVQLDAGQRTVRFLVPALQLDAGAIGKGYALDRVAGLLRTRGVARALIGAGTSSYYALGAPAGKQGWRVHVRDPVDRTRTISTVSLRDQSLSTSGSSEAFFELAGRKYCHIMDPRTGTPVDGRLQVTVIAAQATDSDVLSTALFVLGAREGRSALAAIGGAALLVEGDAVRARLVALDWPAAATTFLTAHE